ncbi:hypothetical protein GW915_12020 [bacterium]|nr:hypothetical protein [bacterium]
MSRKSVVYSDGSGAGKIFLVLLLCALSFLLHAWLRTKVVTASYEVSKQRNARNQLESRLIDLKVGYAKLLDEKNLEKIQAELGAEESWQSASPSQIIFLRKSDFLE